MKYLSWQQITLDSASENEINEKYNQGFVFTRLGKGVMQQTRSIRIDLGKFELSSENRRILKKTDYLKLSEQALPISDYDFKIGKQAKDFYESKFGPGIMSAVKIKEILTDSSKSNFNSLLNYASNSEIIGRTICYSNSEIIHYSYPFYDLTNSSKDTGLGMMIRAIAWAKEKGLKYIYLGSLQRPTDTYKLQFSGIEWFDGKEWKTDIEDVKKLLKENSVEDLPKHVHIIGICGVLTSALAIALHKAGVKVTGSDKGFFPPVSTYLTKAGITYHAGWHPELIESYGRPDLILAGGSGTAESNPEMVYAKENGIATTSVAEALARFIVRKNSIVTVGTWGKTTSSSLLSFVLLEAGLNPSYMTGGVSLSHPTAQISDSDWSVIEGDEYQISISDRRPKFAVYKPTHLLLTGLAWDHADLYPTEAEYFATFEKLLEQVPENGLIVACTDDAGVMKTLAKVSKKYISYGTNEKADYRLSDIKYSKSGLKFTISHEGKNYEVSSPMLGRFNAENMVGAFALAHEIGIRPEVIVSAINKFKGIRRRLEKRHEGDVTVLDCHAPTPDKASAVLESIREIYDAKIFAVFEPNIGGRARESAGKYNDAFKSASEVLIPRLSNLKVSNNEDKPLEGQELSEIISKTHSQVKFFADDQELIAYAVSNAKKGDVFAFLGSHGFRGMIEEVVGKLH